MNKPFSEDADKEITRAKIMGLGEKAGRKSYYPQLQARIEEVELNRLALQKKSSDLLNTLKDLEEARLNAEENEKKFRTLFERITDGIMVADTRTMRIVMNNESASRLLGYTGEELLDVSLASIHPDNNIKWISDSMKHIWNDGASMTEMPVKRRDSSVFFAEMRMSHLELNDTECLMLIMRDITEHKKAREHLAQSHKMDAIGQLAGGIAHDFNNMLSGILGAAELLKTSMEKPDKQSKKLVELIIEAAERAADLTLKLLAFSRKTLIESLPVNVHEAIRAAVALLERSIDKKIIITLDLASPKSMVIGDLTQLQNVFINLGINASHAMPDGGTLTFATREKILEKDYCAHLPFDITPGEYIEIEVSDTGCGISEENLANIFEPFFTTQKNGKGTGLGLAAVYGTVQQHHGALTVSSRIGKGTVFSIYLPLSEVPEDTDELSIETIHGSGKILIVDDEETIRSTAKIFLEEMGYQVILAENGRQAMEIFQTGHQGIDLVILDMIMPEMNGRECFAAMKSIDPRARVIFSTGFINEREYEKLKNEGVFSLILKPYRYAELSRIVAEALDKVKD